MSLLFKPCRVVLIIAGLFSLQACAQTKKTSTKMPAATAKTQTMEMAMASGQIVYEQNCAVCHQADGSGVPHLNPPLSQTEYVLGEKARIIGVVLNGLNAHELINGETYSNVMPAHDFLTDQQIADVLTFVRNSFENKASAVSVAEVAAERAKKK
ncbi:c-type cytochrome [Salmonirosea aquatica]